MPALSFPLSRSWRCLTGLLFVAGFVPAKARAVTADLSAEITRNVATDYPSLEALYQHLHAHPELSLQEKETAARIASEWRTAGFQVTEGFGGYGVVAVLKNGPGPTLLLRTDLDGLPVKEETGLPYASKVRARDAAGVDVPVMHACGHDVHMTVLVGTARQLAALRNRWSGTLVLIGQPAEEKGLGAQAMLEAGLYARFGKPDWAVAIHDSATLPAGSVGLVEGYAMANVDNLDILVRGVGGHGGYPNTTKDPIVLASRIVLALQTIVSREIRPIDPAVVTVGSFNGGTKHNIVPDEVKLQLTLRSYSDDVRRHLLAAVERICRGEAIAAGMPEDRMPVVTQLNPANATPALYNDPALTRRIRETLAGSLGSDRVRTIDPEMGGEDFGQFGRTAERIPLCLIRVGVVLPAHLAESERTGKPLPSLHSSKFAPVPDPSLKTGVTALTTAALNLLSRR